MKVSHPISNAICVILVLALAGCVVKRSDIHLSDHQIKTVKRNVVYMNLKTGKIKGE